MYLKNVEIIALKNYGSCPSHFLGAPGFSSDAMFKMTEIKFEFIAYHDIYIFFEKYTRGRISFISNRYSKANNKYLNYYDPNQESKRVIYIDGNNLHGYVMSKFLSTSGFKWIDPKEFDLNKYANISSKGYVLEVDREYPKQLHQLRNDYHLAPVTYEIMIQIY